MKRGIINIAQIYYKMASILSDMAHRSMYSIIPGQIFDPIAARWAVRGIKDLINYGSKTIVEEMEYYGVTDAPASEEDRKKVEEIKLFDFPQVSYKTLKEYAYFLKKCAGMFRELNKWRPAFGGTTWEKIAAVLSNLAWDYKELLRTTKNTPEEEQILRKLIVSLNVFDGLCHNTGTIYNKIIRLEGHDKNRSLTEIDEDVDKVQKIRDVSELNDPKYLYKEVADIVYPKFIYEDYVRELKRSPAYFENKDIKNELDEIKKRKSLKLDANYYIQKCINAKNIVSKTITALNEIEETIKKATYYSNDVIDARNKASSVWMAVEYDFSGHASSIYCGIIDNITKKYREPVIKLESKKISELQTLIKLKTTEASPKILDIKNIISNAIFPLPKSEMKIFSSLVSAVKNDLLFIITKFEEIEEYIKNILNSI